MVTIRLWRPTLTTLLLGAGAMLLAGGCQQPAGVANATPEPTQHATKQLTRDMARPTSAAPQRTRSTPPPTRVRPNASPPPSVLYMDALQVDGQHLVAANAARAGSCASSDRSACRSALQQIAAAAAALQRDLDAHSPPDCLRTADTTLRAVVTLEQQGAQVGTRGVDDGSSTEVAQGNALLDQGASKLLFASSQLGQSACTAGPPPVAP